MAQVDEAELQTCTDFLLEYKLSEVRGTQGTRRIQPISNWNADAGTSVNTLPDSVVVLVTVHLRSYKYNPGLPAAAAPAHEQLLLTTSLGFEGGLLPDCDVVVNTKSFPSERLGSVDLTMKRFFPQGKYTPQQFRFAFHVKQYWSSYANYINYFITHSVAATTISGPASQCFYESRIPVCRQ